MPGLEPDSQSPFGGFLQGATQGVSLALAIQNQKRAIEEERRKHLMEIATLRNTMGSAADRIIQEMAPDLAPDLLAALPTQSTEERKTAMGTVTPEELSLAQRGRIPGPLGQEKSETLKNIMTGLAAQQGARSRFGALSEATLRAAKNDTETAITNTMKELGSYGTRAAARPDLQTRLTQLQEQLEGINAALGATLGVPALKPKPASAGMGAPQPTKTRAQRLAELKAKAGQAP